MKKPKKTMAESTRVLRSGAKRPPPPDPGNEIPAKRSRSEPSKSSGSSSEKNRRYPLRKPRANGGGGGAAAAAVPRVLPSTKKVSIVRRGRPPKSSKAAAAAVPRVLPSTKKVSIVRRGRPPKSSKALVLVAATKEKKKKKKKKKADEAPGEGESRAAFKQRISDQIKSILLKAGWTIDFRPRNGRNYMDAVYSPPAPFKGSIWSVTKAYRVYLEHRPSSRKSAADPIPEDLLSVLNRKRSPDVSRKRRIKADAPRKKHGRKPKAAAAAVNVGKKKRRRACTLLVRRANEEADDYIPYPWKRTVMSWMIDSGTVAVNAKVIYTNKRRKGTVEGWITREGIRCGCCSNVVTPSEFEAHSGGSKLGRAYEKIIVEEGGVSLLQCEVIAWEKQAESERKDFWDVDVGDDDPSDDTCSICGDGGDLVCCDGCPSTFHLNCLGFEMLPPGDWHCRNCLCKFCALISNAAADVDDASVSRLLSCSQCEQKFHLACIPDEDVVSDCSDSMFCGQSCKMVFNQLQKLLGLKNDLEGGFSWTLIRRCDDASGSLSNLQKAECNSKLAVALAVMDECFLSTIDQRSGIRLIHNVVYNCGANINRLDFSGFHTFILERGDEIISVASVRIHGTRLAEMPYIGTRNMYRRQGMCSRLLGGIESALRSLDIEKLIIPAISELTETWINVFGFKHLELSHKQEVRSINLLVFPGIGLLQKQMLKVHSPEQHTVADGADQAELKIDHDCKLDTANECPGFSSLGSRPNEVTCSS